MSLASGPAAVGAFPWPPPQAIRAGRGPVAADRLDALLWLAGGLALGLVPIGRVSADGLGYARRFATGNWGWNPNHLLFEPAGAWWHRLLAALGTARPIVDQQKLLSILAGAVAVALFRWGVARRLAAGRPSANHATAWLALGSTFSRLLVGDEFHMIQMPLLVAFAIGLLRCLERPGFGRAALVGAAAGAAALCFISNALLGGMAAVVLGVLHLRRGECRAALRVTAGMLLGLAAVTAPALGAAAWLTQPGRPIVSWLTSYAGGAAPARASLAYGIRWTSGGVAVAAGRALYGAASAGVDLAPAVAAARDEGAPGRAAVIGTAWLLAAAALGGGLWSAVHRRSEPAARDALVLQAIWWPAILGFGCWWNNSDDQFYFQLAVALGALAARIPPRGRSALPLLLCSAAALSWNAGDLLRRFILYPRAELTAALARQVQGAGLIVAPGWDEASILLALAGDEVAAERLSLTEIAVAMPADRGLPLIAAALRRCLAAGRRADLVDLYDGPPLAPPWRFLRQLGYERTAVRRALDRFAVDAQPRRAGPILLRSIRPRPGPRPQG